MLAEESEVFPVETMSESESNRRGFYRDSDPDGVSKSSCKGSAQGVCSSCRSTAVKSWVARLYCRIPGCAREALRRGGGGGVARVTSKWSGAKESKGCGGGEESSLSVWSDSGSQKFRGTCLWFSNCSVDLCGGMECRILRDEATLELARSGLDNHPISASESASSFPWIPK